MPRPKQPKRHVEVLIDEESVRDALALWVRTYHGIEIKTKKITVESDQEGRITAKFEKEPECLEQKITSSSSTPQTPTSQPPEKLLAEQPKHSD